MAHKKHVWNIEKEVRSYRGKLNRRINTNFTRRKRDI